MLYKLAPKPVPMQYLQDNADVNNAKKQFLEVYRYENLKLLISSKFEGVLDKVYK